MESKGSALIPGRLGVQGQQGELDGVDEAEHLELLGVERGRSQVTTVDRSTKPSVRRTLRGHEPMFA
jgi:hypothetical protein